MTCDAQGGKRLQVPQHGQADLRTSELALEGLINALAGRLQRIEAFRALSQLSSREAEGRPLDVIARQELVGFLEAELTQHREYRALGLLRQAYAELAGPDAAPPAVSSGPAIRPAPANPAASEGLAKAEAGVFAVLAKLRTSKLASPNGSAPARTDALVPPATSQVAVPAIVAQEMAPGEPAEPTGPTSGSVERKVAVVPDAAIAADVPPVSASATKGHRVKSQDAMNGPNITGDTPVDGRARAGSMTVRDAPQPEIVAAIVPKELAERTEPGKAMSPDGLPAERGDGTEIRFVARPANPLTDILPRPVAPPTIFVPDENSGPALATRLAAGHPEEAIVEIRRPGSSGAPDRSGFDEEEGGHDKSRASGMLSLFTRALRRARA